MEYNMMIRDIGFLYSVNMVVFYIMIILWYDYIRKYYRCGLMILLLPWYGDFRQV